MSMNEDALRGFSSWPDPEESHLEDPRFEKIWKTIRSWDINVPHAYNGYCGATGNHVRSILDALDGKGARSSMQPTLDVFTFMIDNNIDEMETSAIDRWAKRTRR